MLPRNSERERRFCPPVTRVIRIPLSVYRVKLRTMVAIGKDKTNVAVGRWLDNSLGALDWTTLFQTYTVQEAVGIALSLFSSEYEFLI